MKKINKFYVGADHICRAIEQGKNDAWTKPTLQAAIKHAEEVMEEQDKDMVIVVQVVRIVRRKRAPIEVIKI